MFSQKYASKPIQFISINSFGKIVLHAEAVTFLRSLAAPISLVAVLGPSQTGKTFLMQQIIAQGGQFLEGSTTGLWIWSKPMLAYNQEGRIASMVLIDSQGFGLERRKNDQTLLALLLLLSNCLLYNSIGPIDSVSFSELQQVMAVARQLKERTCEFHWILRDFDPALVDSLGTDITGRQYMENQLMAADSIAGTTIQSLKESFPSRDCHCFVKPTPSATEQPPQFLKQIIQIRKCLNGVPSLNLQGAALVAIVQAYIDSLNAGDSIPKACEEGRDCRMRLECLVRLGQELRGLQQRQSCNQIQDLEEQLCDIRMQLKEYYKQRMCSHRQIQSLDEQLNEIIQDFQELNFNDRPRTPTPSREVIRLNVPKPDKMVRLSLNISDSDKPDFDSRARLDSRPHIPLTSIGRINTNKNLHSKLEEFETKIYRYELQATCSKKEMEGLKDDYDRSRKEVESKAELIQQMIQNTSQREREYQTRIEKQAEELQELRKAKIMVESQLAKVKVLHEEKVNYLQEQLVELSEQREQELRLKQEKYRGKLAECLKEIEDLKKSHEQQLAHLKKLYQQSHEQLVDFKHQQSNDTFYKEMREQMQQLDNLKDLLERERYTNAQQVDVVKSLKKQLEDREESCKDALEQTIKRSKQAQRHLEEMYEAKIQAKTRIIEELQQRIDSISQVSKDNLDEIINENNRLLAQLDQKDRKLTTISNVSEQTSREMGKLKDYLQECEEAIEALTEQTKKQEEQNSCQLQKQEELLRNIQVLNGLIEEKEKEIEDAQNEVSYLKGEVSVLQETHEIEVTHLKEQYQSQITELRLLFEAEKQRLHIRLKELQNSAEAYRRLKQEYQELQHDSVQTEFQLRENLDERERELDSTKSCLRELTHECEELTNKNSQLLTNLVKIREESILSCEEAAESDKRVKDELQANLDKTNQLNNQKEKTIMMLRQQIERENKANASKIQHYQRETEKIHLKLRNMQDQSTKQNQKSKETLEESQKTVTQLNQKVALLTHKLTLQEQSLTFRVQSKNLEMHKMMEKVKSLQSKNVETNTLANSYLQQLKQEQKEVNRLQKLLAIFYKEKEFALSNLQDLDNRARINERKYELHLNLFQEKLQEKKVEAQQLRQRLEQYKEDYENLCQIKATLERSMEKESLLWQNKLQMASQHRKILDFK